MRWFQVFVTFAAAELCCHPSASVHVTAETTAELVLCFHVG